MNTLVQGYSSSENGFDIRPRSIPAVSDGNHVNGSYKLNCGYAELPLLGSHPHETSPTSSEGDSPEETDFSDASLKYISQMLMEEEDLEHKPCMFHGCVALQATEKSFYDVIGEKYPPQNAESPDNNFARSCSSHGSNSSTVVNNLIEPNWIHDNGKFEGHFGQSSQADPTFESILHSNWQSLVLSNGFYDAADGPMNDVVSSFQVADSYNETYPIPLIEGGEGQGEVALFLPDNSYVNSNLGLKESIPQVVAKVDDDGRNSPPTGSRGKKNHHRENSVYEEEGRSSKQLASNYAEEFEQSEMYDKVLLCPNLYPGLRNDSHLCLPDEALANVANWKLQQNGQAKGSIVGRPRGKKQGNRKEVVDLRNLLTQCAQAVASSNVISANELLKRIRQHSSPHGDGGERMAHYFADALEARLAGTGTTLYTAFTMRRISAADILRSYKMYLSACPFNWTSNFYANRSIRALAKNATRLHIIDFGIQYGFQWPCLIQRLSVRTGGPPKLRITGIEFPKPGFRPAQGVEETMHRLANYCERFNVPFEYNAIAQKWDTIPLENFKIDGDEVLVVNCLYRLKNVLDETVVVNSPRDAVLNLVKRIKPDMFISGVTNGTFSAPFFVTRFREALYHFSAFFDMFEATVPVEDEDRMRFERELLGKHVMNVIACEGTERVERPETYKQWQARIARAGFRQLPLNQEIVKDVRRSVKMGYHRDFVVDEDGNWLLQGWKGRISHALCCWKPTHDS